MSAASSYRAMAGRWRARRIDGRYWIVRADEMGREIERSGMSYGNHEKAQHDAKTWNELEGFGK